jgi:hypothetical protein
MPLLSPPSWRISRGTVLFIAGLAGVMHETVLEEADRPTLLLLFAAMMGLPAFLPGGGAGGPKAGGPPP